MGLLKSAAADHKADDKADDKAADAKPKKHKKHPASSVEKEQPESDGGADDSGADEEPSGQPDGAEQDADAQGGGAQAAPQPQEGQQDQGDAGDGADGAQGAQPVAQGAQGATPVPNPQAPGAGDDTSGGDDTPDAGGDTPGQAGPAGTGGENSIPQVPISKGLEEEYQRVDQAVQQQLYGQTPLAQHVIDTLQPDGKAKISSAVTMTLAVTRGMYKQTKFPIQIAAHIMHDIAGRIMELGQEVKGIQYSDHDASLVIGAVMEGGMRIFGVTKGQVKNMVHTVGMSKLQPHAQNYHNTITTARQHMEGSGPQSPAGPQSGAPPAGQPSPGAPPQQGAPPPAQPGAGADESAGEPAEDSGGQQ